MAKHSNNAMNDNGKFVLQVLTDKYMLGTFCAEYIVLKRITFILLYAFVNTVRTKAEIRNRYNQVSHLIQDNIRESDINRRKQHTRERQKVSPFPAGDYKAVRNRQSIMTKANKKHK